MPKSYIDLEKEDWDSVIDRLDQAEKRLEVIEKQYDTAFKALRDEQTVQNANSADHVLQRRGRRRGWRATHHAPTHRSRTMILLIIACILAASLASAADVRIAWTPNAEPDLAGYKLYLGSAPGRYAAPVVVPTPPYTFANVAGNSTFYFTMTAYDRAGNESARIKEIVIQTPLPPPPPPPVLSAPLFLAPRANAVVPPGEYLFEWTPISGAVHYDLYIHQKGTPYPNESELACDMMLWCGKIAGTQLKVTLEPNSQYDAWIGSVDAAGVRGETNGTFVVVGDVLPPPPPTITVLDALKSGLAVCQQSRMTLAKCIDALDAAIGKVTPP